MSEPSSRLLALDALRGFTIAAMIVVNTPGSWAAIYPPLRHSEWHGCTPTDLIFPCFLFIVGVSIALAYGAPRPPATGAMRRKILVRTARIFGVGLLLNLWPEFDLGDLRVAGVLQRIALVFGVVAMLFLHLRGRGLLTVTATLLLGYWALLTTVPVPRDAVIDHALATGTVERAYGETVAVSITARDAATIAPNVEPGTNLAAWIDRRLLPGRFYETTWDPEGWLSTLPSLATALLGALTGLALRRWPHRRHRLPGLGGAGLALLAIGYGWAAVFPLNKNLWTSSFVLVGAGWTLMLFALLLLGLDGDTRRPRWAWPGVVFGTNPIVAYVIAGMLTTATNRSWFGARSLDDAFMQAAANLGASAELASLGFALFYTALIFGPVWTLHRRRIFVRL